MDGSATFTTDTSRMTMNWATQASAKIIRSCPCPVPAPGAVCAVESICGSLKKPELFPSRGPSSRGPPRRPGRGQGRRHRLVLLPDVLDVPPHLLHPTAPALHHLGHQPRQPGLLGLRLVRPPPEPSLVQRHQVRSVAGQPPHEV